MGCFCLGVAGLKAETPGRKPIVQVRAAAAPRPTPGTTTGIGYPATVEKRTAQRLGRIRESLAQARYVEAIPALQQFLDDPADSFLEDEKAAGRLVSVKSACESWLAALPEAGIEAYELQYGAEARRLLELGPGEWPAASSRYLFTRAGSEAAYRSAIRAMETASPRESLSLFSRLAQSPHALTLYEPTLSVRKVVALSQAGEAVEAAALFDTAAAAYPGMKVKLSARVIEAKPESREWLVRNFTPRRRPGRSSHHSDWMTFGSTGERRSIASEQKMEREPTWPRTGLPVVVDPLKLATDVSETATDRLLQSTIDSLRDLGKANRRQWWPRSHPVVVGEVLVFRSLGNLRGVELATGRRLWETMSDEPLERLLVRDGPPDESSPSLRNYINQRMWDDACAGRLSSDGERVFAIEDSGSAYAVDNPTLREQQPPSAYNRLAAYDARTGRLHWELGGVDEEGGLPESGTFFLGAPLAVDSSLYVLSEKSGLIRLQQIDAVSGQVQWTQPLAETESNWSVSQNPSRRLYGFSPSYGGGVVICPTGVGLIAAVDVVSRRLLWIEDLPLASILDPDGFQQSQPQPADLSKDTGWVDGTPVLAGQHVLIPRPGGHPLYCLSLKTGKRNWALYARKLPSNARWLCVDAENRVVVLGERTAQAYQLETGESLWIRPIIVPTPCGSGFVLGNQLWYPAREVSPQKTTGLVVRLDLAKGEILGSDAVLENQQPGNLAISQGLIVSQGAERLHVLGSSFPQAVAAEAEIPEVSQ